MDLVSRIKDAVLPDSTTQDTTNNVSTPPVSDAPGGFPDVDDATLGRQLEGENATSQNHKHRDSGVEVDHAPSSKKAESDAPATAAADETGARREETPKLQTQTSPGDFAPTPEVGTGNSADAMTSVEEVKPHHLGNEGTAPVETQDPTAAAAQPQGVPSSTSEGTTSSGAEDPSTAAARPQTQGSTDQVFDAARQQTEGRNATGARLGESGGSTHKSVLGVASAVSGTTSADPNGGIHNGVFGAGSKDPEGEHFVSPHERTSQYRKGEIHSTISGVSESGLGRGGVHNGVIGHGSPEEEEDARRSSDASGQRAEASV